MDNAQFRLDFPEFASTADYPDSMLTFWGGIAAEMVDLTRWGNLYNQGLSLFVAHNIALQRKNIEAAAAGGVPGASVGGVSSKTVGSVSVSYDTGAAMMPNAGHWNMTVYGLQFIQLSRMIGVGAVQL